MQNFVEAMKSNFIDIEVRDLLHQDVVALLGVGLEAVTTLKKIQIYTIFDLATSRIFNNAAKVVETAEANDTVFGRFGQFAADIIDNEAAGVDVTELQLESVELLDGIGPQIGEELRSHLHVETIRDLAYWPPYQAARKMLLAILMPEAEVDYDPEAPPDLIPKSGEYPTEKVFYTLIVLDKIEDAAELPLDGNPVDVANLGETKYGYDKPAFGAMITYEQAWYAQGVALGNLLHSVALAPGESTRIAVVDWSRRTGAQTVEDIQQLESLSNVTSHNRAISEVTSAVATEAQEGFSRANNESSSLNVGTATGYGALGGVGGGVGGGAGGIGGGAAGGYFHGSSSGFATNRSVATSVSSSSGRRELAADMAQNIADRTQQHANSARNRRASIVSEVSQSEKETLTTRVITNYNHMHALTIQYYEVVQIYRMATQVSKIDKCIFVPMKVIERWTKDIVNRFRGILLNAALSPEVSLALTEEENTTIILPTLPVQSVSDISQRDQDLLEKELARLRDNKPLSVTSSILGPWRLGTNDDGVDHIWFSHNDYPDSKLFAKSIGTLKRAVITRRGSLPDLVRPYFPQQDPDPDDPIQVTIAIPRFLANKLSDFESLYLDYADIDPAAKSVAVTLSVPISASESVSLVLLTSIGDKNVVELSDGTKRLHVANFSNVPLASWLLDHLEMNRLHYSQAIWMNMDAATRALLLSPYVYNDKPLLQQIDSMPVTVSGNYLVFRMNVDRQDEDEWQKWQGWLKDHGFDDDNVTKFEIVPLPSGGVFAEAVLGRFNAAEKLDITRFWNWQDSPIPIGPSEIAPLTAGGKTQNIDATPGRLDQPLINVVNPTSLPDPQGMEAILNALTTSNMFRDMSGLAETIALAQFGLQEASKSATTAGQQAGTNMAVAAKTILDAYKAALSLVGGMAGKEPNVSSKNASTAGAIVNQADKEDAKRKGSSSGGKGSGGSNSGGSSGTTSPKGGGSGASNSTNLGESFGGRALDTLISGGGSPILPFFFPDLGDGGVESTPETALVIFIENTGDLSVLFKNLPAGIPQDARNALEGLADFWIEELEKWHLAFDDAGGVHYKEVVFLEDENATEADFKDSMKRLADKGLLIDVITIGHGSANLLAGFHDSATNTSHAITDTTLATLKTEYGGPMPIRAVYMMNCQSGSMNSHWLSLGATVSAGSGGNNFMPEPWLHFVWENWKAGMPFGEAVRKGFNDSKGIWLAAYRALEAVGVQIDGKSASDLISNSAPVFAGDQSVSIKLVPLSTAGVFGPITV